MPNTTPQFGTDEILWYDNGKWGDAGYAIPNPGGKTWTNNSAIFMIHELVGRVMFELLHQQSVRFFVPPHKQFWFELHQMIVTMRKRLADRTRADNDSNGLEATHATPAPRIFIVYPVPFFGERIRQPDIREYAQLALLMLSEIMQHSDNERTMYVTQSFSGIVGRYAQEILALMATKYFGYSRADAYKPDFALKDTDFAGYDPAKVMTSVEMTEERPPLMWWPTENDLSDIRAIPINQALMLSKRWPTTNWLDAGDPSAFPGLVERTAGTPGDVTPANLAGGGVGTVGTAAETATSFTPPPGLAP
jgi:hypothetical protein